MKEVEKTCGKCGEINLVTKSFNCNKCSVWNKFEDKEKREKKGKWLN